MDKMRLTIGKKISFSFLIVLLLMGIMAGTAYVSLTNINNSMGMIQEASLKKGMVSRLKFPLVEAIRVNDFLITGDIAKAPIFYELKIDVENTLQEFEDIAFEEHEKKILLEIKERFRSLGEKSDEIIRDAGFNNKGFLGPRINKLVEEVDRAAAIVVDDIELLDAMIGEIYKDSIEKSNRIKTMGVRVITLVSFLALTFGVIVACLLVRNITRPLSRLISATKVIGEGSFPSDVETGTRDELNELASAFNSMSRSLQDVVKQANSIAMGNYHLNICPRSGKDELSIAIDTMAKAIRKTYEELEAFSYSVSHDLRAPLRHMGGFSNLLQKETESVPNEKISRYAKIIAESAEHMGELIDKLLLFFRMGRAELRKTHVNLNQVIKEIQQELQPEPRDHNTVWKIDTLPGVQADPSLLRLALMNLMANAIKFTQKREEPIIEIGYTTGNKDKTVFFIRDNGVGFDMQYADKLFGVFQRLHGDHEFEGTGIGLANVRRIIHRHGGSVWAKAEVDRGATFYFTLQDFSERR